MIPRLIPDETDNEILWVVILVVAIMVVFIYSIIATDAKYQPIYHKCKALQKQIFMYGENSLNISSKEFIFDHCDRLRNVMMKYYNNNNNNTS